MGPSPSFWETRFFRVGEVLMEAAAGSASLENLVFEVMKGENSGCWTFCPGDPKHSQKLVMSLPRQLSLPSKFLASVTILTIRSGTGLSASLLLIFTAPL